MLLIMAYGGCGIEIARSCLFFKSSIMRKLFVLVFIVSLFACNNSSQSANKESEAPAATTPVATDSASKVAQLSFIDGCVENSKLTLGEQKAFAFCKCMYAQIEAKYPNLDSAGIARLDTATIARLAASCR